MVVALVALFVAVGGSSYAAMQLSRDSVLSKNITDGEVKRADLANNAVGQFVALSLPDEGVEEIFAQGDVGDCWYRVVSGTVRICKLLPDGRRHVAQFCFADDCFGLPAGGMRMESAEAIGDVVVTRYPQPRPIA